MVNSGVLPSVLHLSFFCTLPLPPCYNFYFLHLNLILKLMVAGLLLLPHLLFGMHFHSNLDLVIPFLLLNLSSRRGFLKLVMMLYRMMMFLQDDNVVLQFCRFRILFLFLLCKALLDHWEFLQNDNVVLQVQDFVIFIM